MYYNYFILLMETEQEDKTIIGSLSERKTRSHFAVRCKQRHVHVEGRGIHSEPTSKRRQIRDQPICDV